MAVYYISPRFVHAHLANSYKKQAVLLNYWDSWFSPAEKYIQVHDTHHHHQNHRQDDFVKLYLPPHVTGICFINSCDGLICLSNRDSSVIYIYGIRQLSVLTYFPLLKNNYPHSTFIPVSVLILFAMTTSFLELRIS